MAESPFQPMQGEELGSLRKQNKRTIVEDIIRIKELLVSMRDVDMIKSSSVGELVEDLEATYKSEKNDQCLKQHWDGIAQTLAHLNAFHTDLLRKYAAFIAELSRNNNIDLLIRELDLRIDELTQST